jgi:predicted site-specific integrase-resolvase
MESKILQKVNKDLKTKSLDDLAKEIGVGYGTLYRFIKTGTIGTLRIMEKIESHYKTNKHGQ